MPRTSVLVRTTLIAVLLALVVLGLISYRAVQSSAAAARAVTRTTDTLLTLERALSVMRDAEIGQRGYLLTGDVSYLEPYRRALAELNGRMDQLHSALADDRSSSRDFAELERLVAAKTAELARTIELYQGGDQKGAIALVMTNAGRSYMDSIRAEVGRLQGAQSAALGMEQSEQLTASHVTDAVLLIDRLLALGLAVVLVLVVRHENRRVRLSEEWLAITLRSIGDAVIATDARGQVRMLNAVAEGLTGWRAADARGVALDQVFNIINEESRARVESPVSKALREGRVVGLANHTLLIRKDGSESPIEDSAAPITNASGDVVGVVLVFRDATSERAFERTLIEADRNKDEFIAVLAHELRNPLAPILQASKLAGTPGITPERLRWSLEIIERQAQTMARLLDDLLDVSRITRRTLEIRKTRVPLSAVIDSAVETTRPAIEAKGHRLTLDLPAEPIELEADPVRLSQVIANLLKNAAKYTDAGGEIRLAARRHGTRLNLSVLDTGIGLSPEALPRVFDMFVQVKESLNRHEGGLGIGLALARRLVELHQGSIEARSAGEGHGSEFSVELPCLEPDPEITVVSPVLAVPTATAAPLRILVADDNRDAAESLTMLLQLDGHEVHMAHDGNEAWVLFDRLRPQVALLDIGMPGLNGYQLVERIRAQPQFAGVTLVALTGWGQRQDLERGKRAGFDHHLVKPTEPDAIREILASLPSRA